MKISTATTKIPLLRLINVFGVVTDMSGEAIEGHGVFSPSGIEWPAGIAEDGSLYASEVGANNEVMALDGSKPLPNGWNVNNNYSNLIKKD